MAVSYWSEDFGSYADGTDPNAPTWTKLVGSGGTENSAIVSDIGWYATKAYELYATHASAPSTGLLAYPDSGPTYKTAGITEIAVRVKGDELDTTTAYLSIAAYPFSTASNFYGAGIRRSSGVYTLYTISHAKSNANSTSNFGTPVSVNSSYTANSIYWLRVRVDHTASAAVVYAKFWKDGESEPGSWTINGNSTASISASTNPNAGIGVGFVGTYHSSTAAFQKLTKQYLDIISYAAGTSGEMSGVSAPVPQTYSVSAAASLTLTGANPEYSPHMYYPDTETAAITANAPFVFGSVAPDTAAALLTNVNPEYSPHMYYPDTETLALTMEHPEYSPHMYYPGMLELSAVLTEPLAIPVIMPPGPTLTLTTGFAPFPFASVAPTETALTLTEVAPFWYNYATTGVSESLVPTASAQSGMEIPTVGTVDGLLPTVADGVVTPLYNNGATDGTTAPLPQVSGALSMTLELEGET